MKRIILFVCALLLCGCAGAPISSSSSTSAAPSSSAEPSSSVEPSAEPSSEPSSEPTVEPSSSVTSEEPSSEPSSLEPEVSSEPSSEPSSAAEPEDLLDPAINTWSLGGSNIERSDDGYYPVTDYPSDDNGDVTFRFENAQRFDGSKNGHYLSNTIIMRKSDGVITQLTGETKNLTIVTFRNWVQYAEMDMSGTVTIYAGTEDDPTLWDAVEPQVDVDEAEATITYSCTLPNHSKIRLENRSEYAVYIYTMASAA